MRYRRWEEYEMTRGTSSYDWTAFALGFGLVLILGLAINWRKRRREKDRDKKLPK